MRCSRCDKEAVTSTRGEDFCEQCYHFFISKKFRAAMGEFRVNGMLQKPKVDGPRNHKQAPPGKPPLILVFVSYGACSFALVDLLLDMQEAQRAKNNGMSGFDFQVVHIGDTPDEIQRSWPWPNIKIKDIPLPSIDMFADLTQSLSRSSIHDMESVLIRQTALAQSLKFGATAVFGYSVTRLSEITLTETIKGRGSLIPKLVSPDLYRDHFVYPLKDITLPELREYCRVRNNLLSLVLPVPDVPGITKMQSIDEIVHEYFVSVQESFPSVVSTVAKVASRLSQPAEKCALCNPDAFASSDCRELCYACSSALSTSRLTKPVELLKEYEL